MALASGAGACCAGAGGGPCESTSAPPSSAARRLDSALGCGARNGADSTDSSPADTDSRAGARSSRRCSTGKFSTLSAPPVPPVTTRSRRLPLGRTVTLAPRRTGTTSSSEFPTRRTFAPRTEPASACPLTRMTWKPSSSCHVCARLSGPSALMETVLPDALTPVTLTPGSLKRCCACGSSCRNVASDAPAAAIRTRRAKSLAVLRRPPMRATKSCPVDSLFLDVTLAGAWVTPGGGGVVGSLTGLRVASGAVARRPFVTEALAAPFRRGPSALFVAELVADAPDGQHHLRVLGVVLDLGSQAVDV